MRTSTCVRMLCYESIYGMCEETFSEKVEQRKREIDRERDRE